MKLDDKMILYQNQIDEKVRQEYKDKVTAIKKQQLHNID